METVLPFAAAINAAFLAAALGTQALRKNAKTGIFAAIYLCVAAAAVAVIAAEHAALGVAQNLWSIVEGVLTVASGPLFLFFAASSLGVRLNASVLSFGFFFLAVAIAAAAQFLTLQFLVDRLVFVQIGFTAASAALVFSRRGAAVKAARARRYVMAAIIVLSLLHAAQLARTLWPEAGSLRNIVPFLGAAALFALSAAVYFGGRLGFFDALTQPPPVATDAMRALVAKMEAALGDGLLKNPDISAIEAAAAIGAKPEILAEAVRAVTGGGFAARLQQLRVEEAQRLLADPKEARTSMEAVGLLAGFGSRSAFYEAFGERAGMSPAAYRKSLAIKPVRNEESGQV
jgi:AraC-like DNA-binding protein